MDSCLLRPAPSLYDLCFPMRLLVPGFACLFVVLLSGCPSNEPELFTAPGGASEAPAEPGEFLSTLYLADPRGTPQLLKGFHTLEQGSWRWTEKVFAVALKPPPVVPGLEVNVELTFSIAEASISRLGPLTLSATLNGSPVGSETYGQAGDYTFTKPVPADVLASETIEAAFELDKVLAPSGSDLRELGVIAVSVALK